MNILFVHQNFPGQFKFLAPELVKHGHDVKALCIKKDKIQNFNGIEIIQYKIMKGSTQGIHPWVMDVESKIIRAEACLNAAIELSKRFKPDVIIAHPGWGESLFLKKIWPNAKLGIYCEFFYQEIGADTGFDPEFSSKDKIRDACRLKIKNINNFMHFEDSDAGLSPTHWQASTFPREFRDKISVIHDGIDTNKLIPNSEVTLRIKKEGCEDEIFANTDEVITFVNRNLEPYRGYHIFMRSLPSLLSKRPNAKILIVGGSEVSYGGRPNKEIYGSDSWKKIFIDEVKEQVKTEDWGRVHFLGHLPYAQFIALLQISSVHVYLTYPFVLSWSLLEAMSIGCAIVASDTKPLHEAIIDGETGQLVDFFDHTKLTSQICNLLEDPGERKRLGLNARNFAIKNYDLKSVCLPKQLDWVLKLAKI
jgi:glycosyltransferase involved in cell wall biosynthesis